MQIQTTKQIFDQNLAALESAIGQTSPIHDKAFLRVLAGAMAMAQTGQNKLAVYQIKQVLALTADVVGLEQIGLEYNVIRKAAESAVLTISIVADDGVVIPATAIFTGAANGVRYYPAASVIAAGGIASLSVTAEDAGVIGNLNISDTLSISSQVAGASSTATVTAITNTGADIEAVETYRARVLAVERGATGGGNANDYKIWAEEVAGVKRAFPYSGKPFGSVESNYPGDRTVYVECQVELDADGIPDQALLDEVRAALNTNPNTGYDRVPLGLTDETLYVEPISRQSFFVAVSGLAIQSDLEAQVKDDIETALETYFLGLAPFVVGIDFQGDRRDRVTPMTVAEIIQNVLTGSGGSVESVEISLTNGGAVVTSFVLDPGVLTKLGGEVVYA